MDPCFPDWNIDSDPPFSNQRKPNPDLMELLYRNGQVVAQSQTHRRPSPSNCCQEPPPKQQQQFHQTAVSFGDSDILGPDTVTASWIEYPVEDSFDKEFSSHFFIETSDAMENDHTQAKQQFEEVLTNPKHPFVSEPLPRTQLLGSFQPNHKSLNFGQFSTHRRHGSAPRFVEQTDVTECSGMTVGSSHCGSNHVQNMQKIVPHEMRKTEIELNVTSSSDGSGSSFGVTNKNSAAMNGLKRKGGDVEDSECQSEDAEQESAGRKKSVQQSGSTTRKSRAAEVHNLSERKRRDRINKKMRALQELIPHCNKTDKASMLDEAIEYLKSLQVQLQMMWMGSAMSPMMFQGMQPYMSPMAMGMGAPHPMSTVHSNMNLRKVPMVDQSMPMAASTPNQTLMSQTPILNPMNFHPMQNQFIPDQFARYMTMHQMQAATNSQPMNMFMFGPQPSQPPQTNAVPVTIMGQHGARTSTTDALSSKIGN